jgi:5-dehydro-2-deoxygluconokinase
MSKTFDLICMGRSTLDLFGDEVGADFADLTGFRAYVGGCPTNICVGAQRMGLQTALITGVGDDFVSGFLLKFLRNEGIDTRRVLTKPGYHTNTVLVALQPPEAMQFVAYVAQNADLELTVEDVLASPLEDCRAFLFTGMCLIKDPSRTATATAAETAANAGAKVLMDLDYRVPMWADPRIYGTNARLVLPLVDVAIGGEDEVRAAASTDDLDAAVNVLLSKVREALIVKRGVRGCTVYTTGGDMIDVSPFSVKVVNFLGAGDAFAGGFTYGYLNGWSLAQAATLGNACGAMVVAEHGTANAMPTHDRALAFVEARGGF